jgi:hypothetical protein
MGCVRYAQRISSVVVHQSTVAQVVWYRTQVVELIQIVNVDLVLMVKTVKCVQNALQTIFVKGVHLYHHVGKIINQFLEVILRWIVYVR